MKISTKNLLIALLVMVFWGSLFPMIKIGYEAFNIKTTADILLFAGIRFTICGLVICLFCAFRNRQLFLPAKAAAGSIMMSGVFAVILHYGFTYIGLTMTDSSKTAILKQVGVLLYVCFSFLFFKDDKPTVTKLIGAAVGFLGIAAINYTGTGVSFHTGDALILAASFCTVFSNVISKRVFETVDSTAATGLSQLFGGAVLLLAGAIFGGRALVVSFGSVLVMIYICFASVAGYCLWFRLVRKHELSRLFIIKFAEPVFASIFGALLLGENILNIQYISSFILIAVGICITNTEHSMSKYNNPHSR